MERVLRNKCIPVIIVSDSDESEQNSLKELKVAKKTPKRKQNVNIKKKIKGENIKNEYTNKIVIIEDTKEIKSNKRKRKEETNSQSSVAKRKRLKAESTVTDNKSEETLEDENENRKHQYTNIEHDPRFNSTECTEWNEIDYVTEVNKIEKDIATNVIKLFKEDNTIPFIARYRKCMTDGMGPDLLRSLKDSYDQAKFIKQKAATIIKSIDKLGKWTPEIHAAIVSTKSLDDLEYIHSLFKTSKQSLAEKARKLGLNPISNAILQGQAVPCLATLIDSNKEGLKTEKQIKEGIMHILADVISKDKATFEKVKILQSTSIIEIHTTQCKSNAETKHERKNIDESKYEMYFNFKSNTRNIRPHQILAINRAESCKIINVKIVIPDYLENAFQKHCVQIYKSATIASKIHLELLKESIDYAFKKFIKPLIVRRIRSELKEKAEVASIEVFATNVKQLLLTPPVRGKVVLGIDPGFHHGCKLAIVSEQGNVLETAVIYPHKKSNTSIKESAKTLINLVNKYNATIFALGNATACRETEVFLSSLIKSKAFGPLDISYTIVDEAGASIYSCSSEAISEFPELDPNVISAISIARRIQDPLAELVKVEPKHLGVGMYQHDLPEKQLLHALNEVVSEAVSFVGVDVNTASHSLLKRVAGLNVSRATNIIEWRNNNGPFINRQQLLDVKGIGNKTFEQCAGFIRIMPETAITKESKKHVKSVSSSKKSLNPLDQTWIHPESYKIANNLLKAADCNIEHLGSQSFIERIKSFANGNTATLCKRFNTDESTLDVIIKGLTMRKDEDIRANSKPPLFRASVQNIDDLTTNFVLSGAVRNVTHFGVFVDVGVGRDGLIPIKYCKGQTLSIGQRVEVKVTNVERERNRISLELINIL